MGDWAWHGASISGMVAWLYRSRHVVNRHRIISTRMLAQQHLPAA